MDAMTLMTAPVDGPVPGDAFGQALARCWASGIQPGQAFEVIERDDGYLGVGDAARYFASPEDWSPAERQAVWRASGRILDIGCGAGRHAVVLRDGGHDVTGLELSPGAAGVARDRGIRVVEGSIVAPPSGLGRFDTLLLLGNNLGLLGSATTAGRVLTNLADLAAPDARVIGIGMDPYQTTVVEHLAYHELNRHRGRYPGQIRMRVRDGVVATDWFDYLFLSPDEFVALVAESRWKVDHIDTEDGPNYLAVLSLRTG
jgi:SAM-dependent methyltransferase